MWLFRRSILIFDESICAVVAVFWLYVGGMKIRSQVFLLLRFSGLICIFLIFVEFNGIWSLF